jgi:hypothetical protein
VVSWNTQLEATKKEIADLEHRISTLRAEMQGAQSETDAARLQQILAIREQHLERAKFHAQFVESRIAKGQRTANPIPYSALASICFNSAERTPRVDTAEALKALGKNFSAKATADASRRLFGSDSPDGDGA